MTVVAAFLVPGLPHPLLKPEIIPWSRIAAAGRKAGRVLAAARADVVAVYSTQWIAVLDQLWQTRPHLQGIHVDENWYEWGDLEFDIRVNVELADACIAGSSEHGLRSRAVNYDGFPIDTGTVVADRLLNPDRKLPLVITSNNIYHDWATTERLGRLVAETAKRQGKRIAFLGVGGLSGRMFRTRIDPREDRIAEPEDDRWNRRMLELMERGDIDSLRREAPSYVQEARADMGFKHLAWIIGALGGRFFGARVHGYGPLYGSGAAVVEFKI
jgi:2-aminophenol/2-amino-5-chlorophenol 1,6-dioxygenase alpha subunit